MLGFTSIKEVRSHIQSLKDEGKSVGFVPTMGALHPGHLSLLERSVKENDVSVCSIFVNPIQFNNASDLEKYPRTLQEDSRMLEQGGCDIVFSPSVDEMYPEAASETYDFGQLELVMEGAHRPGHFNGVAVVVKRLFDICIPSRAYFGKKDFQQLMIIRAMTDQLNLPVEIIGCPIIREADGLAMSSRNVRLSSSERAIAPTIYRTLKKISRNKGDIPLAKLLDEARQYLDALPGMDMEYLQVVNENTLMPLSAWDNKVPQRVFVAIFLGEVRLIDNLKIGE
jgi:pantoate--beta-alanine ligase